MPTLYLAYRVRSLILNPSVIAWSILFVLFWVFMWVYVFGNELASFKGEVWYESAVKSYVAVMYSSLGIVSMGSVAVALTGSNAVMASSIRYVTRFTRLTSTRLLIKDLSASILVFSTVTATIVASSILLSWHRYGVLVVPEKPLPLVMVLLMLGLFFYLLSIVMTRLILLFAGARILQTALTMMPLAMSFIPYALLFTKTSEFIAYAYPPIALQALAIEATSGIEVPPTGIVVSLREATVSKHLEYHVNLATTLVSYLVWITGLALIAVFLSKRIKAVHPEELMI